MKNRYIILILSAVLALSATSCNKFLDTLPDNRTELDSEEKIKLLLTSAYPSNTYAWYLSYMSDDNDDIGNTQYSVVYDRACEDWWNWRDDTEEGNDSPKSTWNAFYLAIAHANQALQAIEELGNPPHLDPLRGEALMARAFCHFKLVNLFCQHYSTDNATTDMGIPYVEEPETEVNPIYPRGTVQGVYEKIERDILEALPMIDDATYKVPKYHFNRAAALGFAAEFYLYYMQEDKSNLDKVIGYADQVLGENPELVMRNLVGFDNLPIGSDGAARFREYIRAANPANLLLITNYSQAGLNAGWTVNTRYNHSENLARNEGLASYSALWSTTFNNDDMSFIMRPTRGQVPGGPSYFLRFSVPYIFEFTDPVALTGFPHSVMIAVSTDNVLLCRAEAQVLKGNLDMAMEDINRWVKMRIVSNYASPKTVDNVINFYGGLPYYTSTNPTPKKTLNPNFNFTLTPEQEAFIHAVLHLRRIEFWGEGARWFDVKRWGIEITRRLIEYNDIQKRDVISQKDILIKRDLRRAIQLPVGVRAAGMEANPR